jgi:hypothetical protein
MNARAVEVTFKDDMLVVRFSDGRELLVPLDWFPVLAGATAEQQRHIRISASGLGLHWHELDEDISVPALLRGHRDLTSRVGRHSAD